VHYPSHAIGEADIPRARNALLQHQLDTYASETNKIVAVWNLFDDSELAYRPHERSMTVEAVFKHQLLSERRFFAEFLSFLEPPANALLPAVATVRAYTARMQELARPRLARVAAQDDAWWTERVPFFDVERERIWIFWRRVLHSAHHRTQLTIYLRLLGKPVPAVYGPTADVTWTGADPTTTVDAANRR
jgi:uncharacterized damage-inducible protein DinB